MESLKLIFKKALEDLRLNPEEYRLILTGDIPALGINALGTACRVDKKVWLKDNLSLKDTIKIILHEVKHLAQFKQGYRHPRDTKKMELEANLYTIENVIRFQLIAKCGDSEPGLRSMLIALQFFKTLT